MNEHQKAMRQATEAELFRLLVENVIDYAIFVLDPDGRVRSWNPGAERLLGYSEAEIIGQPAALFFTPDDIRDGVQRRDMAKAVETGRGEDERWHVRKDGSRFWSIGTVTPLWDEDRNLRGFAKIMRDRTSQKHSDDALKDALTYAEGVVETVREPLLVLSSDLRVKTANRSFYQTFQVLPRETEGRLIYHLGDHQWDIPLLRKLLEEILPLNHSFDGFEVEHEFRTIGSKVMLLNARRFVQKGDQTALILLAIEDITDRKYHRQKLEEANALLELLAATDGLTRLKNRRRFQETLTDEVKRANRSSTPLSIMLLDVDHFKQFNDTFGHPAGDSVLECVARLLEGNVRSTDFVARYGGEEFAILLPDTDQSGAILLAERVRQGIADGDWRDRGITVSIGVATMNTSISTDESLVREADIALYRSKNNGRNCVHHSEEHILTGE